MIRVNVKLFFALGVILLFLGCTQNNPQPIQPLNPSARLVEIDMQGVAFVPIQMNVDKGTTIRFTNSSGFDHDLEIVGILPKQVISNGQIVQIQMNQKGTFDLKCERHLGAGMEGTITVN